MENKEDKINFTPDVITTLLPNEVFVFGSNMNGNHWGGAAKIAHEKFGAVWGKGRGLCGQSYALPTLDEDMKPLRPSELKTEFMSLIRCAEMNPNLIFYLTKVGCGIAGFKVKEVRDIWRKAVNSYYMNKTMLKPRLGGFSKKEKDEELSEYRNLLKRIIIPIEFCY